MKDFYQIPKEKWIYEDTLFFMIYDGYAVSPGHILIITKEIRKDYFELTKEEKEALPLAIEKAKELIELNHQPDGYNIGMNCGIAAGQSIIHFHCHLIPRYTGDMKNPKGGIRYCIPKKGLY